MRKNSLLRRIINLNAGDPMVANVMEAIASEMEKTDKSAEQVINDMFFDSCSEEQLEFYEWEVGITPLPTQSKEDRGAAVAAKWKSQGKVDIEMLQAVADSWKHGKVAVDFVENKIQITFVDQFGLPADRDGLERALDEVKPAHLPIIYYILYLMCSEVEAMTLSELEEHTLADFAFE